MSIKSSISPQAKTTSAAASNMPSRPTCAGVAPGSEANSNGTATPNSASAMASPPTRGVACAWTLRALGSSTSPQVLASQIDSGVAAAATRAAAAQAVM